MLGVMPLAVRMSLDEVLVGKLDHRQLFREKQEGVWSLVDGVLLAARALAIDVGKQHTSARFVTHRVMMWQTMIQYQTEAFLLIVDGRLDEGLGLLRMAAELARDSSRMGNDEAKLTLWLDRSTRPEARKPYRKTFRFSDTDPIERYVRQLYRLASESGIHGHATASAQLEVVQQDQ
jgi:hypothetical protein